MSNQRIATRITALRAEGYRLQAELGQGSSGDYPQIVARRDWPQHETIMVCRRREQATNAAGPAIVRTRQLAEDYGVQSVE